MNNELIKLLRCSSCKNKLKQEKDFLVCTSCNSSFKITEGFADMVPSELDYDIKKVIDSWENISFDYDDFILHSPPERLQKIDKPLIDLCIDGGTVLDVGCGTARVRKEVIKHGSTYVGIDPSIKMLKNGQKKGEGFLIRAVAECLPFPDNHFDNIIGCYHSFRYINLEKGFPECARVLKTGGILAFTLWNHWSLELNEFIVKIKNLKIPNINFSPNKNGCCNDVIWALNETKKLEKFGFEVQSIISTTKLPLRKLPYINRVLREDNYLNGPIGALMGYDIIFICKKL